MEQYFPVMMSSPLFEGMSERDIFSSLYVCHFPNDATAFVMP